MTCESNYPGQPRVKQSAAARTACLRRHSIPIASSGVPINRSNEFRNNLCQVCLCLWASVAQALAKQPRVLLLDEPFGALDPGTRSQMHALIKPLWRDLKMTIVMVTHDIKEAFGLATRLIALDRTRRDPQAPERYGAKITYDLDLTRESAVPVLGFLRAQAEAQ